MTRKTIPRLLLGLLLAAATVLTVAPLGAKTLSPEEKQLKADERNVGFMEKQIASMESYLEGGSLSTAGTCGTRAENYYNKLSDATKATPEVVALKAKLDQLAARQQAESETAAAEAGQAAELFDQKTSFSIFISPNKTLFFFLVGGRDHDANGRRLDELDKLIAAYPEAEKLEATLRTDFALLLEQKPDFAYDGFPAQEVLDLLQNRETYRNAIVEAVCALALDKHLGEQADALALLEKQQLLASYQPEHLYGPESDAEYKEVAATRPYYEWIGARPPADKVAASAAFKGRFRDAIDAIAAKTKWKDSNYPDTPRGLKKVAAAAAERRGMELVECGMADEDEWKIVKNELGIPLRKVGTGYVLFRKPGEPFSRGYVATLTRVYNGSDYEDISEIALATHFTPHAN